MQKGSALIFLFLISLVAIISGGVIFYLNKQGRPLQNFIPLSVSSKKANPETYTNKDLNFEFKYKSEDLIVKEDTEEKFNKRGKGDFRKNFAGYVSYEPGKFLGAVVVLDKSSSYDQNPFTLWVFDNPNNLDIDNWYKNYWYYPFVWGDFTYDGKLKTSPQNEATISGQMAKSGIVDYQPGKPKFIYLSKDKSMYLFRIIGDKGEKILQSFKFIKENTEKKMEGCKVGGCSGQLCVEEGEGNIVTTCEYRQEYACYKLTKCERQADGKCGWTQNEELTKCLQEKRNTNPDMPQ